VPCLARSLRYSLIRREMEAEAERKRMSVIKDIAKLEGNVRLGIRFKK
jgi:hypothetical protein